MISKSTIIIEFSKFCLKHNLQFKKTEKTYKKIKYQSYELTDRFFHKTNILFRNEISEGILLIYFMESYDANIRYNVFFLEKSHKNLFVCKENIYGVKSNVHSKIFKKYIRSWVKDMISINK